MPNKLVRKAGKAPRKKKISKVKAESKAVEVAPAHLMVEPQLTQLEMNQHLRKLCRTPEPSWIPGMFDTLGTGNSQAPEETSKSVDDVLNKFFRMARSS
ncbi:MAG: hypothetical protein COB66_06035 [Coxiella sp. (in: Bacteria)]|nr:MAG: hypothetical protein COB66_06035 [Coxiella sp. (in: g-proteobacteria)]